MRSIVLTLFISIKLVQPYKIPLPNLPMKYCLRVTVTDQFHTIFVDNSNETDQILLKECIIKNIHLNQTILLLSGPNLNQPKQIISNQINLIIMTKFLNYGLFDIFNKSLHNVRRFHWNIFYIVVTVNDGTYTCKGGKFDEANTNVIQNFLNDFWLTFRMMRVILVFPVSCPQTYVLYGGKLHTSMPLYNRTIKLIRPKTFNELSSAIIKSSEGLTEGYPLKVTIFPRFPTSLPNCNNIRNYINFNGTLTNGICGLDGLIMHDTLKHLKFNVIFINDEQCYQFGYVNYTHLEASGSLGCVLNGTVDISFNSRFMINYGIESFNYLYYVMHDSLCALLPVPKIYPLWHYPHAPINYFLLFDVILVIFLLVPLAWISDRIINKLTGQERVTLKACLYDFMICMLCGFSPRRYSRFYLIRGTCLACSIIYLAYYQGYINYSFTTFKRYERIKTLQQLYDLNYVLYTSPPVRELIMPLKNPNNPQEVNFIERANLQPRTDIGIVLDLPKAVTLGRYSDVRSEIQLRYCDRHGKPRIYVVNECFRHHYLSYISKFGFPFTKTLRIFMERLSQAGIPDKYYIWTRRTLHVPDLLHKEGPEPRPNLKINLYDQIIPFGILLFGYLVSTITFIIEFFLTMSVVKLA
ncbi:uncharacterized protein LOC115446266 isoform X1 [Manduca sexta]|uniref:uncharacterized protein LOC115446266 isoform X1 n=1 Tax=Manduca sexta TaxID=7130 RepID=UPI00188ED75B|nr:uncharacterized protein LOC115446266 isoform X1 [Manduca sexta]